MVGISAPAPLPNQRTYRLTSIDMLRGLVIVIMALDHVRDFFMTAAPIDPMADPNVGVALFATRWITHFCAPVFVFLAGTSAGLMTSRRRRPELTRFLFTRGVWLIAVECLIVSTAATFAPAGVAEAGGAVLVVMQVIWAIGASMVVLSLVHRFGRSFCLVLGTSIVLAHNLLDLWWPATGGPLDTGSPVWVALHAQMAHRLGPVLFVFIYPVLPWIGVMLAGFGAARLFELPPDDRNRRLVQTGLGLTAAFIIIRALDLYGDPNHWQAQAGVAATTIDFLNTTKYPPSLEFLLMTLGPAAVLCGFADRWQGRVKDVLTVFGRVPFAFYVAHVVLIHALSVALGLLQGFDVRQMLTVFLFYPAGYGVSLAGVYAVWMLVIAMLYPFCRWMAGVKTRRRDWWLSYL